MAVTEETVLLLQGLDFSVPGIQLAVPQVGPVHQGPLPPAELVAPAVALPTSPCPRPHIRVQICLLLVLPPPLFFWVGGGVGVEKAVQILGHTILQRVQLLPRRLISGAMSDCASRTDFLEDPGSD